MNKKIVLSIQEIADLKGGRKSVDEIRKTHDGTSMGQLNGIIKNKADEYRKPPNQHIFIYDENLNEKMTLVGSWEDDKNGTPKIPYNKIDTTNNHLIKTVGMNFDPFGEGLHNNSTYGHFDMDGGRYSSDIDKSVSPFKQSDMSEILKKDKDGNYISRGITLISQGGSTMTLIKNNKFDTDNEKQYKKLCKEFQNDIDYYIDEAIPFHEYMKSKGYESKFKECNVRFVMRKP